jgi:hypothetical protein
MSSPETASLGAMGLTNPLLIAWELLPWSFVVDWFLPVGKFVENMDATAGLTFKDGYLTTYEVIDSIGTVDGSYLSKTSGVNNIKRGIQSRKKVTVYRQKLTDFPSNPAPSFKNPVSLDHMLNAMALLSQTFKR